MRNRGNWGGPKEILQILAWQVRTSLVGGAVIAIMVIITYPFMGEHCAAPSLFAGFVAAGISTCIDIWNGRGPLSF
jgi:hypothetical protein